jgi:CheY-like chemotaxis protein
MLEIFLSHLSDSIPEYKCLVFQSGAEALSFLAMDPCVADLIVSDQTMPVMTGTDFLLECVKSDYLNDFIIFSGDCDDNVSFNLLKAEMASKNPFLTARMVEKPNFTLLMDTIREILDTDALTSLR